MLDNFDNLQASWVTQGGKVGQLSLAYGANDMGSVMIEENVVRAAGASYCMDEVEIVRNIENAGFVAKRRNMHYEILGDPIFRERDVPRMLELAVARADGDTSRAPELDRYAARSAAEKQAERTAALSVHDPVLSRRLGICRSREPPIRDGWVARRSTAASSASVGASRRPSTRRRRRRASISATSPCCPASSTRTRISSCRGCAGGCRRREFDAGVGVGG